MPLFQPRLSAKFTKMLQSQNVTRKWEGKIQLCSEELFLPPGGLNKQKTCNLKLQTIFYVHNKGLIYI
jgi:hypothetical protein